MIWPGPRELVFSLKAFAAAMLGFWINCALDLPRPTWAIFIVYVLIQPLSGAIRSDCAYRMLGSAAGAATLLVLVGLLANLPGALFLAVGLTTFTLFFLGMIERMPRGHAFTMAGLTVTVLGLPDALDPLTAFPTAIARLEEILLGILSITLIDSVFFPHPAGVALNASVATWLADAKAFTLRALRGPPQPGESHGELARLAAAAAQLDALSIHVAYDSVPMRPAPRMVRLLHTRMLRLIRLMFTAQDWNAGLHQAPQRVAPVEHAMAALADWVEELPAPSAASTVAANAAIDALRASGAEPPDAAATLRGAMGLMLRDLMTGCEDCVALQRAVADNAPVPDRLRHAARTETLAIPHGDPARALLLLLPVGLAFLLVFAYYTATGWEQGPRAATMTILAGVYASVADEPAERLVRVVAVLAAACAVALIYQFALLPAVQDFPLLVLALGLFLVPAGAFIPITAGTGLMLCVLTTVMIGLQPEYVASFAGAADATVGALAGVLLTAVIARVTVTPGTAWTTRHLLRAGWSDLAAIAAGHWHPTPATYALRALDRYTVLAPHLDKAPHDPSLTTAALLGELRIGLNLLRLREEAAGIPEAARPAIDTMLSAVARHYQTRRRATPAPPDGLRAQGDAALRAAEQAMPAPGAQVAWLMLAGVQRSLFGTTGWSAVGAAAHAG
jgi:uncharacterized membrane protein YccC